jgi:hypothetical protein
MPESPRKGWVKRSKQYQIRKDSVESRYGKLGVEDFIDVVKMTIAEKFQEKIQLNESVGEL